MAKPSITKRTTKGAALTYSELDTNFQNLADATVSLTAGSGGTAVTVDLNGNITLVAGTGITLTGNNTAKTITINAGTITPAGSNQQIQYNNNGALGASANLVFDGTSLKVSGNLESLYQSGDEGGEIYLNKPATNTSITNGVTIDVYQNRLRIFEAGGTNRGGYFDITALSAGVNSNLFTNLLTNAITIGATDANLVIFTAAGSAGSTKGVQISSRNAVGATGILRLGADNTDSFLQAGGNGNLNLTASGGGRINLGAPVVFSSYTTVQRDALTAANGMMIYNTTTNKFQGYANGAWVDLH